jgi:hypothetical protein
MSLLRSLHTTLKGAITPSHPKGRATAWELSDARTVLVHRHQPISTQLIGRTGFVWVRIPACLFSSHENRPKCPTAHQDLVRAKEARAGRLPRTCLLPFPAPEGPANPTRSVQVFESFRLFFFFFVFCNFLRDEHRGEHPTHSTAAHPPRRYTYAGGAPRAPSSQIPTPVPPPLFPSLFVLFRCCSRCVCSA